MADTTIDLPERLDTVAAPVLHDQLRRHLGQDVTLNAGALTHVGALSAQVLLSAVRTWSAERRKLAINDIPHDIKDQLQMLGLSDDILTSGEPQ